MIYVTYAGPPSTPQPMMGQGASMTFLSLLLASTLLLTSAEAHAQTWPSTAALLQGTPSLPPQPALFVSSTGQTVREVRFDLSGNTYPPLRFPAYYLPATPPEGKLALRPNVQGGPWLLVMRILPFSGVIQTGQLEYRVLVGNLSSAEEASVPWLPALNEQVIATVDDPLTRYTLQLRLRVEGHETAGEFTTDALFTLKPTGK